MFIHFQHLRVWLLALILPLLAVVLVALGPGSAAREPQVQSALVLLNCLQYLIPPLAALFLLSFSQETQIDLLLVRPIGWPGIVIGRWVGAVALFGSCYLLLLGGGFFVLAARGGGPGGRVEQIPVERLAGIPGKGGRPAGDLLRSWPAGSLDVEWLGAVRGIEAWAFEFAGLSQGRNYRAWVRPLIGRMLTISGPNGNVQIELARARSIDVRAEFLPEAGELLPGRQLALRDRDWLEIEIPAGAVSSSGRLWIILTRQEEPEGKAGPASWGPRFFWFDPEGGGDSFERRDIRLERGEIVFALNVLRAGLRQFGELLAVAALAGAACALFSPGIAFGCILVIYLLGRSKSFLTDVMETLTEQSALILLSDPGRHAHGDLPTWFDRGLEQFLTFWNSILPDFQKFHEERFLLNGQALELRMVAESFLSGALYAAGFLAIALLILFLKGRRP